MTDIPSHIGRYQVIDAIGQGGMGSVYLARDPAIGRLVAIKLLKEEFDEDQRHRFEREAHSVGQLEHSNIVTVYDVGDHKGRPFIAMSYIPGETLSELIRRRAPLPLVRKLRIVEDLCAGLHAAHKAGIVHRDIKPANVMVDPDGVVKILDFGIARLASEATQKTQEGTIIGSYNYMSPEQIVGKPLNHRSDIFAVGAIFYEVLCYTRAFGGSLRDGLWYRLVHEPPPPLRELCDDLDEDVERIVMRALEKDPAKRYQEIDHMRRETARARRRLAAAELDALVSDAEQAMREEAYDLALAKAQAALALEPDEGRALDLADHAHKAIHERRLGACLAGARKEIAQGALAAAAKAVQEALAIDGASPEALALDEEVQRLVDQQESDKALRTALERAQRSFDRGDFEATVSRAEEALKISALSGDAQRLRRLAVEAIDERDRRAEHETLAREAVTAAERRFESGDHEGALTDLASFAPPHPLVTVKTGELQARADKQRDARQRLDLARRLIADGDFAGGLAAVRELESLEPQPPGLAGLKAEAQASEQGRQAANNARRESRQRLDEARTLHEGGNHRTALKVLEAVTASLPASAADLRAEVDSLRDRVEDAFTLQILEAERRREVSDLLARARATTAHEAALPMLRKLLEIEPGHAEAKALLAERTAAREDARVDYHHLNRLAEVRVRIEAHLAKNELVHAERALLQAERDFQDQDAFATLRRRIEELRRLAGSEVRTERSAPAPVANPNVDPDTAPTVVVERTRLRPPVKSRPPATTMIGTALVIAIVILVLIFRAC